MTSSPMGLTKASRKDLLLKCDEMGIKKCKSKKKNELIQLIQGIPIPSVTSHLKPLIKWSGGKSEEIKLFEQMNQKMKKIAQDTFDPAGSEKRKKQDAIVEQIKNRFR